MALVIAAMPLAYMQGLVCITCSSRGSQLVAHHCPKRRERGVRTGKTAVQHDRGGKKRKYVPAKTSAEPRDSLKAQVAA